MADELNFDDLSSIIVPEATQWSKQSDSTQEKKVTADPSYKGTQFAVMNKYNLGTLIIRPILDTDGMFIDGRKVPRFYRLINNVIIARLKDDSGYFNRYTVPDVSDFVSAGIRLNQDEFEQLKRIREKLFAYRDIAPTYGRPHSPIKGVDDIIQGIEYKKEVVLMIGKLINQVKNSSPLDSNDPTLNQVRIFRFDKGTQGVSTFKSVFDSSLQVKDMIFGQKAWRAKFFSREIGSHKSVLVIRVGMTTGGKQNYSLSVDFSETGPDYEITQEDLDLAGGLNSVFCDVSHYNKEYFNTIEKILSKVQGCIDNQLANG